MKKALNWVKDWFMALSTKWKIVVIGVIFAVGIVSLVIPDTDIEPPAKETKQEQKAKKPEKPVLTQNDMDTIGQQISDIQHSGNLIGSYITGVSNDNVEDMANKITWEVAAIVDVRHEFNNIEGIEKAKQVSPKAVQLKNAINNRAQFLIDYGTYTAHLFYGDTSAKLDKKWEDTVKADKETNDALASAMNKFGTL
ncbi:hypothetical protein GUE55_15285 [Listeria monocytogenes]|nr:MULTISPECIES: hypothetical protein [Listeria]EAF3078618.1 hypothetical protein [Listeria monocytogenes serotype 1/2a]EAC5142765.1 hypothetical protein [Listeria monocytogenes]EAC6458718.1 hypothetical protein [Listeria monocytogenes]EAC7687447.1 hypothetical protein [Listeria monocytogenes]EAC7907686.1 hypothetical protein [Listeria monocytogenes]